MKRMDHLGEAAAVFAAIDALVAAVTAASGTLSSAVDLTAVQANLVDVSRPVRVAVLASVDALVSKYSTSLTSLTAEGLSSSAAVGFVTSDLAAVVQAALAASVPEQLVADADAATQHEVRLQAQHAETVVEIDDAVRRGDIDEVMRLRPIAEVTNPEQLDTARLAAYDAATAVTQAVATAAAAFQAEAIKRTEAADATVENAKTALAAAEQQRNALRGRQHGITFALTQATDAAKDAATQRETLAANVEAERHNRLRRLAGLPTSDLPAASTTDTTTAAHRSVDPLGRREHGRPFTGGITRDPNYEPPAHVQEVREVLVPGLRRDEPPAPGKRRTDNLAGVTPQTRDTVRPGR